MPPVPPDRGTRAIEIDPIDPNARAASARARRLESLLDDLGPHVERGARLERLSHPADRADPFATGLPEIDRLLAGGLPRGRLCEISGRASSGRTSFALSLLARATTAGECAALVDLSDAFDPASAHAAGVALERVLWVRAPSWRTALRCTERLLGTEGLPLVLLDVDERARRDPAPAHDPSWLRLARLSVATRTALVVMSDERLAGTRAEIALDLQRIGACFSGSPRWLDGLETRADLVRHRSAPDGRTAAVRWRHPTAA